MRGRKREGEGEVAARGGGVLVGAGARSSLERLNTRTVGCLRP